jgi:hypothetical protein
MNELLHCQIEALKTKNEEFVSADKEEMNEKNISSSVYVEKVQGERWTKETNPIFNYCVYYKCRYIVSHASDLSKG